MKRTREELLLEADQLERMGSEWQVAHVAAFFGCHRATTYRIRGLEACRVAVPGLSVMRFDPAKVRKLQHAATRQRPVRRGRAA